MEAFLVQVEQLEGNPTAAPPPTPAPDTPAGGLLLPRASVFSVALPPLPVVEVDGGGLPRLDGPLGPKHQQVNVPVFFFLKLTMGMGPGLPSTWLLPAGLLRVKPQGREELQLFIASFEVPHW
jgi:hypothetical protein